MKARGQLLKSFSQLYEFGKHRPKAELILILILINTFLECFCMLNGTEDSASIVRIRKTWSQPKAI